MFITFEGGEGTGKSTQVKLLAERLRAQGRSVLTTREPGGTPEAEALRKLLVSGEPGRWSSDEELLIVAAARSNHLRTLIRPALLQGIIVICDRFVDSTYVYQVYAGSAKFEYFEEVSKRVIGESWPSKTFILDVDPAEGVLRSRNRMAGLKIRSEEILEEGMRTGSSDIIGAGLVMSEASSEDRFERKGIDFHKRVRAGFATVAQNFPERCILIDAFAPPNVVADRIWATLYG